jgi:hypothetical protein
MVGIDKKKLACNVVTSFFVLGAVVVDDMRQYESLSVEQKI